MKTSNPGHNSDNVIDLFTGKPYSSANDSRIIRLSPELDGLEMLYSNEASEDKFFSLKILCWGLRANGEVVGLVPWLDDLVPCPDIEDPLNGAWEGYYDPGIDELFFEPPIHKIVELETAAEYYEVQCDNPYDVVQEIPDTIGTHAVLSGSDEHSLTLQEVVSWRLFNDGTVCGMLVDEKKVESTPVLPGDSCLYPAQTQQKFRYFFQHHIANKIKSQDPEALAAISLLVEESSQG
ncbi:hypothetical protein [Teredinibacter turnerae]|uniref:Uncharacterized protein n=1 Tax=Teredinibacter turnerae (strain ATCC 39867 / T7901) TaxID=377629 RepID=C5BR46_TERTT|nr:hypothetical protein [Teredinibacter turnerae]ACR11512.1 conserved hypothetical protein [Teredinibacter turnerae T7901]